MPLTLPSPLLALASSLQYKPDCRSCQWLYNYYPPLSVILAVIPFTVCPPFAGFWTMPSPLRKGFPLTAYTGSGLWKYTMPICPGFHHCQFGWAGMVTMPQTPTTSRNNFPEDNYPVPFYRSCTFSAISWLQLGLLILSFSFMAGCLQFQCQCQSLSSKRPQTLLLNAPKKEPHPSLQIIYRTKTY